MMVHRRSTSLVDPNLELSRCLTRPAQDAEAMTTRLLGLGSLECALADLWSPHRDGRDPRTLTLAAATRWAARALIDIASDGSASDMAERHLRRAITACLRLPLPAQVELRVPEGFAYYAVHPLCYDDAVRACLTRWRPSHVAVVGIRSIGSTLAAVAMARCEREGVSTWGSTLRPRGDPLDRECLADEALAAEIQAQRGALCLVVDEGPGPSGSSLMSAAALLEAHGHPADRIVVICSREAEPDRLRSPRARARWSRQTRVLAREHKPAFAEDWSAGKWRDHLPMASSRWPAVHPQHERQKGVPADHPGQLHKFVGLGPYGAAVCRRAGQAADAGFSVPVFGMRDGYLRMARLAPASPMTRRGTRALVSSLLGYLPWRARTMQTGARADADAVIALLAANTREEFGGAHDAAVLHLEQRARSSPAQPAVILDGHLAPWEWLQTPQGVVKVDTAEHGDDPFLPGPQDIAWDVAAALSEFAWSAGERTSLVEQLSVTMKDPSLADRLGWMRACYLAARLGYSAEAAEALGETADGLAFGRMRRRYARQLGHVLAWAQSGT